MAEAGTQYFLGATEIIKSYIGDTEILINPYNYEPFYDGLSFYVDAGVDASYPTGSAPATGSNWYSLSSNITASLWGRSDFQSGIPTWNAASGGYFSLYENGAYAPVSQADSQNYQFPSGSNIDFTFAAWVRVTDNALASQNVIGINNKSGVTANNAFFNFRIQSLNTTPNTINYYYERPGLNQSLSVNSTTASLLNKWVHLVVTRDSSDNSVNFYQNGVNILTTSSFDTRFRYDDVRIAMGYAADVFNPETPPGSVTQLLLGDASVYQIYNKALNQSEVELIYDTFKGRYGF